MKYSTKTIAILAFATILGATGTAAADPHRHGYDRDWHDHDYGRSHRRHHYFRHMPPPAMVIRPPVTHYYYYEPAPVIVTAPPPPPSGLSLIVPMYFR